MSRMHSNVGFTKPPGSFSKQIKALPNAKSQNWTQHGMHLHASCICPGTPSHHIATSVLTINAQICGRVRSLPVNELRTLRFRWRWANCSKPGRIKSPDQQTYFDAIWMFKPSEIVENCSLWTLQTLALEPWVLPTNVTAGTPERALSNDAGIALPKWLTQLTIHSGQLVN